MNAAASCMAAQWILELAIGWSAARLDAVHSFQFFLDARRHVDPLLAQVFLAVLLCASAMPLAAGPCRGFSVSPEAEPCS